MVCANLARLEAVIYRGDSFTRVNDKFEAGAAGNELLTASLLNVDIRRCCSIRALSVTEAAPPPPPWATPTGGGSVFQHRA